MQIKTNSFVIFFLYSRRVILSLQNHGRYTRGYLMTRFKCSLYEINQAQKKRSQSEGVLLPSKTRHICRKLNMDKVEHFYVAYGTHNIKFDSGLKLKVANAKLTTKYPDAVTLYLKSCTDYEPLSTSTLFHILRAVKPSQGKSLGKYLYTFIVTNFAIPLVDISNVNI